MFGPCGRLDILDVRGIKVGSAVAERGWRSLRFVMVMLIVLFDCSEPFVEHCPRLADCVNFSYFMDVASR